MHLKKIWNNLLSLLYWQYQGTYRISDSCWKDSSSSSSTNKVVKLPRRWQSWISRSRQKGTSAMSRCITEAVQWIACKIIKKMIQKRKTVNSWNWNVLFQNISTPIPTKVTWSSKVVSREVSNATRNFRGMGAVSNYMYNTFHEG